MSGATITREEREAFGRYMLEQMTKPRSNNIDLVTYERAVGATIVAAHVEGKELCLSLKCEPFRVASFVVKETL